MPWSITPYEILNKDRRKPDPQQTVINVEHPLTRGLIRYWVFNEGGGLPNDYRKRAGAAAVGGGAPAWTTGDIGRSILFTNTASDYFTFGTNSLGLSGTNNATVFARIRPVWSTADYRTIYARGTAFQPISLRQYHESSSVVYNQICLRTTPTGTLYLLGTGRNTYNTWVTAAGTFNGAEARLYHNGISDATPSARTESLDEAAGETEAVGGNPTPNTYYNGRIDEVMVWARCLTQQDIQWLTQEPYCILRPLESIRKYYFSTGAPPEGVPIPVAMNIYRQRRRA